MKHQGLLKIVLVIFTIMIKISKVGSATMLPDTLDFFPEVGDDLSKITWGHAINDQQLLEQSLSSESAIMMLEADVSKGHLEGQTITDNSTAIPVMSHPPKTVSDLSLEMWIMKVIEANKAGRKKGAKLDFKNSDIVLESLKIVKKYSSEITFPLWMNADIVKGPGGENLQPIDADIFLSLCSEFFPRATLSIGFSTSVTKGQPQKYTEEMMQDMIDTVKKSNIDQPITFPIRATFVSNSLDTIEMLMKSFPGETITIWTSASDDVELEGLASLQDLVGQNIVYFDIPEAQKIQVSKIRMENANRKAPASSSVVQISSIYTIVALAIGFVASLFS